MGKSHSKAHNKQKSMVPTYALDDSLPYFRLIPQCANPNITARILGYCLDRQQVILILLHLCRKSRSFVNSQIRAILQETLCLQLKLSDHLTDNHQRHTQVYPLRNDIRYDRFVVGVLMNTLNYSYLFVFSDGSISNFDVTGIPGGVDAFKARCVKPQDYNKIRKVSIVYSVTND